MYLRGIIGKKFNETFTNPINPYVQDISYSVVAQCCSPPGDWLFSFCSDMPFKTHKHGVMNSADSLVFNLLLFYHRGALLSCL